ncbi:MAG: DUF4912 domain-containing protein [Candidatus Omnitrophota bacterium]|jgi:hypothetical protein|nr:MAG: DUF4912 domain-containing protein [Candidatus Omnitrophota bacterium]
MAILRKLKEVFKKLLRMLKLSESGVDTAKKQKAKEIQPSQNVLGNQEVEVGMTKFSNPENMRQARAYPQELSGAYGKDKMVLQVRDPWWLHAYWEITEPTWSHFKSKLGADKVASAKLLLRAYDVTGIDFDGKNANRYFDIDINRNANNWYVDTGSDGRSWCVDIGLMLGDGRFITILRSNFVTTPLAGPSWITDEEWMIPDDLFARLYGMGFGFGKSSPVGKGWQEKIRKEFFSSPGFASMASPVKQMLKEKQFWLVVNTELIVYGATEPDAKVYVQNKEINLRPDGTFSLRFALPDGKQVIPVKAVSRDQQDERIITPVVKKETK